MKCAKKHEFQIYVNHMPVCENAGAARWLDSQRSRIKELCEERVVIRRDQGIISREGRKQGVKYLSIVNPMPYKPRSTRSSRSTMTSSLLGRIVEEGWLEGGISLHLREKLWSRRTRSAGPRAGQPTCLGRTSKIANQSFVLMFCMSDVETLIYLISLVLLGRGFLSVRLIDCRSGKTFPPT